MDSEKSAHAFPYNWTLSDAVFTKDKGTVFSCFACGGGSTMGYKLAGFNVLGCNEIDPKMMAAYRANHDPKYSYLEPIQTFKLRDNLPNELYNLDILDGSPPCSSFSVSGKREKHWGKKKKFREGQSEQVLDNLFFDFIDLAQKIQPKVVIAENVKGLMFGNAKEYVRRIYHALDLAGYYVQHWLLDASKMGVPQKRERIFFIALRKDLATPFLVCKDLFTISPNLNLEFNESEIKYNEFSDTDGRPLTGHKLWVWERKIETDKCLSDINERERNIISDFNCVFAKKDRVLSTIVANNCMVDFDEPQYLSDRALILGGSYPLDYDFLTNKTVYLVGMSVPPVMMAQIAQQVYKQWLSKL